MFGLSDDVCNRQTIVYCSFILQLCSCCPFPTLPVQQGHERPLTQVKYNHEGDLIISCAKNLQPCLWFAEDGKRIGTYEGHNGAVWSCDMTIDSERLITSSADQTVRIWNLPTGEELFQIKMSEPCRACHLAVGEQLMAFTTDSFMGSPPQIHLVDMDLQEFDRQGSEPKFSINCPKGRVTRVYFTDCNRVLITSHDGGWVSLQPSHRVRTILLVDVLAQQQYLPQLFSNQVCRSQQWHAASRWQ